MAYHGILDAIDNSDNSRLTGRARHQIGASVNYNDQKRGWNANLAGTWNGSYLDSSTNKIKDFGIWNLMVNKELNKTTTIYVGVDNLTDYTDVNNLIVGSVYRAGIKMKF